MCESSAYLLKDGEEELVLKAVELLENRDGQVEMTGLCGEKKRVRARVKALSLVNHKIVLEPR